MPQNHLEIYGYLLNQVLHLVKEGRGMIDKLPPLAREFYNRAFTDYEGFWEDAALKASK